ncbi:uncharacterized protein LOC103716731 isoform X2 [Phoenix dactylifera]|uniref:Uncharacterized protein LOC103716731 isoform X2 n=1 Tax=Phoenix dactylifera TaxID=42345 RepID=A0A8B8ZIE1_PHODC|nr:uncharacterized protein LOC103716731 isoform X2 [Phoenix dactylifera]
MGRKLLPISSISHCWRPPGCDDDEDDEDDEPEHDTALNLPRFWLQHDGTICSEDFTWNGWFRKYKREAALELLVLISRNITRMRWLDFNLKVLDASNAPVYVSNLHGLFIVKSLSLSMGNQRRGRY